MRWDDPAMGDEPTRSGWLPPRAPGGREAPQFEMAVPDVAPSGAVPEIASPAAAPRIPAPLPPRSPQRAAPNGLALTSVILGLCGILLLVLSLGLGFPVALPCSIASWLCGANARTRINLGEATTGRGQAQAGYLLGVAGVVIGVAAAVGWIIWLANGGDLDQLQRDIQRWSDRQSGQGVVEAARALLYR
jgi:hypothetical protein